MIFLFPSDYFNPKKADAAYLEQVACMQNAGFTTSVISLESLGSVSSKIIPVPEAGSKVVYRGWMLSQSDYELLVSAVESTGASVLNSTAEYLATHYIVNWYPLIVDLTPETKFYSVNDDLENELNKLGWNGFFIKDYVKSLKTSVGSIINKPSEIRTVITEMQKFRGSIEGGICVRQIEDFIPETERRYFVIYGKPFAASPDEEIPEIVEECARRIESKFFSVDVIECRDGSKRIVEIGDGQVSDLVGWTSERFAQCWVESNLRN
ncbi:ATP-grasp domain-containing protein [Nostoc sp. FACHB-152]|uniref:ATP-grasp domain-containing protein n=1 Tax=unclassified Nostoc TaxID=2593658 RepID=UPI00168901C1|nr:MULTISPECIES: ATP-grasp domain-containing protein [unclassified Nostoc]MBD2448873.1 ATP-grasp domain-containing protein [Nostoc sp. FACHB-152]MBD2469798.1 ATP-grasp domain-containing protein [Nostoc sp. FACHB-145]